MFFRSNDQYYNRSRMFLALNGAVLKTGLCAEMTVILRPILSMLDKGNVDLTQVDNLPWPEFNLKPLGKNPNLLIFIHHIF